MNADSISSLSQPTRTEQTRDAFSELGGDDFLKLLIMQITNQDPLEPVSNEDMLRQIASIRDIEASTTLTQSLRQLTQQQSFGSPSSLIGRYVTSAPDDEGQSRSGLVTGVRFEPGGRAVLRLESGVEVPIEQVQSVETALHAAEGLIGKMVLGLDRRDLDNAREVQGVVTAVQAGERNEVYLELDTGDRLRFRDVTRVGDSF